MVESIKGGRVVRVFVYLVVLLYFSKEFIEYIWSKIGGL